MTSGAEDRGPGGVPGPLVAWAHLAALWSLAVAQPLFDVLDDTPEFFVARGNTSADIVGFAFALVLLPPTAMVAAEALLWRLPAIRRALHLLLVGLLVSLLALQVSKDLVEGAAAAMAPALLAGGVAAWLYARRPPVRSFLTVLAPAPALFLALFLLVSPVSELVLPQEEVSARGDASGATAPVVMVVFDELSGASLLDDRLRIDARRYPGFAELARGSTWYRNATTVDYATERAVPALLSGFRSTGNSLPIAADHPRNLFTMLGDDYRMNVRETATTLCPESVCGARRRKAADDRLRSLVDDLSVVSLHVLLPDSLESRLPAVDATFEGFGGGGAASAGSGGVPDSAFDDRAGQFARFLDSIDGAGSKPALDLIHLAMPHWSWRYLPSGRRYLADASRIPGTVDNAWVSDPGAARLGEQRYLLQLGFTDLLLQRLIRRLRDEGLWNRALVVVAADHGVSFRPGQPRRVATQANLPDIASVPLFVKAPGQRRGRIDDSLARTVDIVPTIADLLGVRPGWEFDGRSLRRGAPARRGVDVLAGEHVTAPAAVFERRRRAAVLARIGLFGSGASAGLFAPGGYSELLGRPPGRVRRDPPSRGSAGLDPPGLLDDVDPGAAVLPALVGGTVEGGVAPGSAVALALNGTIRAVASVYRDRDELHFGVLVPAGALRRGRNAVDLYVVGGRRGDPSLAALAGGRARGPSGSITERDGSERLVLKGGALRVVPAAVDGYVESVRGTGGGGLEVRGWAADPQKRASIERVLVFADGRLVGEVRPEVPRADLVPKYGPPAIAGGFRLLIAASSAAGIADDPSRLRVFAVLGPRAAPLERLSGDG